MPSPDQSDYHSLALYDRSPYELVERAGLDLVTKFPGLKLREGMIEMALLEAIALEVAEQVFAINRLPDAVTEVLIQRFGIFRSLGTPPVATATFHLADTLGYTIPQGTLVRLDVGSDSIDFTTDVALVVGAGSSSGTVGITGARNTIDANDVTVGTALQVMDPLTFVDSAELATSPSGGQGVEDDEDWHERAMNRFGRLTDSLVLPSHFTARALEDPLVDRAMTLDNWNVSLSANGHVTTAVLGPAGALLSAPQKQALEDDMEAATLANLELHIIDPTITTVAVTVQVKKLAAYDASTVQANVQAAINGYLDPNAWEWSGTVRRNEMISVIDQAEGVSYVDTLTIAGSGGDVAITGVAPLAKAGVLSVTVI